MKIFVVLKSSETMKEKKSMGRRKTGAESCVSSKAGSAPPSHTESGAGRCLYPRNIVWVIKAGT